MRIRVTTFWQSATVKVPPGEYEADDPRLGGMAEHLVRTQQAEVIPSVEELAPVEPEAPAEPPPPAVEPEPEAPAEPPPPLPTRDSAGRTRPQKGKP